MYTHKHTHTYIYLYILNTYVFNREVSQNHTESTWSSINCVDLKHTGVNYYTDHSKHQRYKTLPPVECETFHMRKKKNKCRKGGSWKTSTYIQSVTLHTINNLTTEFLHKVEIFVKLLKLLFVYTRESLIHFYFFFKFLIDLIIHFKFHKCGVLAVIFNIIVQTFIVVSIVTIYICIDYITQKG